MDATAVRVEPKAISRTFSIMPRHLELVVEMAARSRNLNKSQIVQEAIEEKAARDLGLTQLSALEHDAE